LAELTRLAVGIALGVALAVLMLLIGGIFVNSTPTPHCDRCAVLMHPSGTCTEQVVGGYICP
jgi:hypothetical protein